MRIWDQYNIERQYDKAEIELYYLIDNYSDYFSYEIIDIISIWVYCILPETPEIKSWFMSDFDLNKGMFLEIQSGRIPTGVDKLERIKDKSEQIFITEYNFIECSLYCRYHDTNNEVMLYELNTYAEMDDFDNLFTKHIKYLPNREIIREDIVVASNAIKYFYDNKQQLLTHNKYNNNKNIFNLLKVNKEDVDQEYNNKFYSQMQEAYIACEEIILILKIYSKNFCTDTFYTIRVCLKLIGESISSIVEFINELFNINNLSLLNTGIEYLQFREVYKNKESATITAYNLFDYFVIGYKNKDYIFNKIKECKDVNLQSIPDNLAWYDKRYLPYREITEEDLVITSESIKNFYNIASNNSKQYQY